MFGPLHLAALGFFALFFGVAVMLEAGASSARGVALPVVEREGRFGARLGLAGIALVVLAGAWSLAS